VVSIAAIVFLVCFIDYLGQLKLQPLFVPVVVLTQAQSAIGNRLIHLHRLLTGMPLDLKSSTFMRQVFCSYCFCCFCCLSVFSVDKLPDKLHYFATRLLTVSASRD